MKLYRFGFLLSLVVMLVSILASCTAVAPVPAPPSEGAPVASEDAGRVAQYDTDRNCPGCTIT